MNFKDRSLAIVDIETTGDIPAVHEILEIGLIVANQETLEIKDRGNWMIKPHHIEDAIPAALERNGYKEEDWAQAIELEDAMPEFAKKTENAIFLGYNVSFDWSFIVEAFRKTKVKNLMDYHRLDVMSLAWFVRGGSLDRLNLKEVSQNLGVPPEPDPHRAVNGAETALQVLRELRRL